MGSLCGESSFYLCKVKSFTKAMEEVFSEPQSETNPEHTSGKRRWKDTFVSFWDECLPSIPFHWLSLVCHDFHGFTVLRQPFLVSISDFRSWGDDVIRKWWGKSVIVSRPSCCLICEGFMWWMNPRSIFARPNHYCFFIFRICRGRSVFLFLIEFNRGLAHKHDHFGTWKSRKYSDGMRIPSIRWPYHPWDSKNIVFHFLENWKNFPFLKIIIFSV